jgi:hypothetical protein
MRFMFRDGCVKIICDLELKILEGYSISFGVQRGFVELQLQNQISFKLLGLNKK